MFLHCSYMCVISTYLSQKGYHRVWAFSCKRQNLVLKHSLLLLVLKLSAMKLEWGDKETFRGGRLKAAFRWRWEVRGRTLGWGRRNPGSPPGWWRRARLGRTEWGPTERLWRTCRSSRLSSHPDGEKAETFIIQIRAYGHTHRKRFITFHLQFF